MVIICSGKSKLAGRAMLHKDELMSLQWVSLFKSSTVQAIKTTLEREGINWKAMKVVLVSAHRRAPLHAVAACFSSSHSAGTQRLREHHFVSCTSLLHGLQCLGEPAQVGAAGLSLTVHQRLCRVPAPVLHARVCPGSRSIAGHTRDVLHTFARKTPPACQCLHLSRAAMQISIHPACTLQEVNSMEAIKQAVEANLGVAFVSNLALQKERQLGRLHVLRIQGIPLVRSLRCVTDPVRYCSRAVQAFIREMFGLTIDTTPEGCIVGSSEMVGLRVVQLCCLNFDHRVCLLLLYAVARDCCPDGLHASALSCCRLCLCAALCCWELAVGACYASRTGVSTLHLSRPSQLVSSAVPWPCIHLSRDTLPAVTCTPLS